MIIINLFSTLMFKIYKRKYKKVKWNNKKRKNIYIILDRLPLLDRSSSCPKKYLEFGQSVLPKFPQIQPICQGKSFEITTAFFVSQCEAK